MIAARTTTTTTVPLSLLLLLQWMFLVLVCTTAQQVPYYETVKFDDAARHRTDLCERHMQVFMDNITLPQALDGLNLSVVLTNYTDPFDRNFFGVTDTAGIDAAAPPLFAVVLDELAIRAGFTWRDTYGVVTPIDAATDGNRTWSDLLRWEVETYDIAMGKWDRTTARLANEILFPEGWYDASVILVQSHHEEDTSLNLWGFLLPFKPAVWFTILVVVIVSGLLYFVLEWMDDNSDRRHLEGSPVAAVYYSFISAVGHNEFLPQTHPARLLAFSIALFALIVGAAYTANLASFLVARRQLLGAISSVEEAILLRAPICLQRAVALDQYITEKYPAAVLVRKDTERQVFEGIVGRSGAGGAGGASGAGAASAPECSVALVPVASYETYRRNADINYDCSLGWQGRVERHVSSGLATVLDSRNKCTSLVAAVLDYYLMQMQADGFLERVWEEHLERVGDQSDCMDPMSAAAAAVAAAGGGGTSGGGGDDSIEDETYSLSIQEMAGVFIVHGFLSMTAVLIAVVQYWFRRRRRKRSNNRTDEENEEDDADLTPTDRDFQDETMFYEDDELALREEEEEQKQKHQKQEQQKQLEQQEQEQDSDEELQELREQLEQRNKMIAAMRDALMTKGTVQHKPNNYWQTTTKKESALAKK